MAPPVARQGPPGGPGLDRVPPAALFVVSGFSQYYGAALAVGLFATFPALGVSWWRIALSAVFLLLWRRPWRHHWSGRDLAASALFGVVLAAMNLAFYLAISHLPLGIAVSIEFIGPVTVAAVTGRGRRERWGIALAAIGVLLLAGSTVSIDGFSSSTVTGLVAIAVSGICWAGYILLGRRIATTRDGISYLAVGMAAGALVFAPFGVGSFGAVATDGRALLLLAGVAIFSSVLPYAIEQVVLRRVSAAQFAILLALLPVAAAVVGGVVLHQIPTGWEMAGMTLVCVAIAMSTDRSTPSETA